MENQFKPYLISLSCGYYLWVDEVVNRIARAVFGATKIGIAGEYLCELLNRHPELKTAIDTPSPYLNELGGNMNTSRWETVMKLVQAEGMLDHIAEKNNTPEPPVWRISESDYAPLLTQTTPKLIAEFKAAVGKARGDDFGNAVEFTRNGSWWNKRMPYRCMDGKVRLFKDGHVSMRKTDIAIGVVRWQRTEAVNFRIGDSRKKEATSPCRFAIAAASGLNFNSTRKLLCT